MGKLEGVADLVKVRPWAVWCHKIVGQDGNLKIVKAAIVVMRGKKVKGLYRLEGSFVRGGTVGSVIKLKVEGLAILVPICIVKRRAIVNVVERNLLLRW
ncbi:hypothetical protein M0R45_008069 [Rubus argutus]|uniref:Uncharacterized protein n=1 Tax=Rubus argutus TaxID=59490 RepID=A0AAW1Y038_RUBAR